VCALQDFELAGWCSLSLGGAAPSAAPDYARAGGHGAADSFLVLSGGGRRGRAMGSASPTAGLQQHGEGRRAAAADRGRRFLFCNSGSGRTVELGRSGRTIMRPRADRSAPARRIPAGAAADPRRPSSRPRRLSYAVAVANSPIDKSAALALRRPLMRWGDQGRSFCRISQPRCLEAAAGH
jgi:hypothetical protein